MGRTRTIFRRVRTLLWTALTLVTLLAAILVGVGKLLMPYSVRYQPQLEEWLSRQFQQPVVVDSFTGQWKAFGPRISFEGVTLMGDGQGEGEIVIQHAALDIKPLNALIPNRPLYSFHIIGADLSLVRTADGRYELSGLGVSGRSSGQPGNAGLRNLTAVGEVRLEDSSLSFDDEERDIHVQLTGMRGRLQLNGRELSTELEANISDAYKTRVLGDLKATLQITMGEDQRISEARWHVKTGELMISELVRQLPQHALIPKSGWLNAEIWGSWSKESNQVMEGVVDLRESILSEQPDLMELEHLNTRFRWSFHNRKAWRIDLSDLRIEQGGKQWKSAKLSVERNIPGNLGLWLSSEFLDLEFPIALTQRIISSYNNRWPRLMPRQMSGEVRGFDLVLNSHWKLFMLKGELDMIDARDWDKWPDVAGISGSLALLDGEGEARFSGQGVKLDWPANFPRPAIVDIPQCTLEILWGETWQVDARDCTVQNEQFSLYGRSRFAGNGGKPEMDINIAISRAEIGALDEYWPRSVMSPKVIDWLRSGLVSGHASNGRFQLRGDMDDWPFRGRQGILQGSVDISDAELDYYPDWPRATRVELNARFQGTSMTAEGSASFAGVPVQRLRVHFEDFKQPILELDYRAQIPLPDMVRFLERTPLLENTALELDQFRFENMAETSGRLVAPLRASLGELSIDGQIRLEDNRFTELRSAIELEGLAGEISYDREGMTASSLAARYKGHAAALSLRADWDADEIFQVSLNGTFPVKDIIPESLLDSEPLLSRMYGSAEWDIELAVNRAPGSSEREIWLDMQTDLSGITLDFPQPLNKPAERSRPLQLRYPVHAQQPVLSVVLDDLATLQFELGDDLRDVRRANFHFGQGFGELPAVGLLSLDGSTPVFDLDQWMDLVIDRFNRDQAADGLIFRDAQLHTDEMLFLNRSFAGVELDVRYENDILTGRIESADMAGSIRYSRSEDGSHSLAAEMDRLFMPDPIDQGMTMDTDPSELPEMHLYARQFRYMGLDLGETRIEAYPLQNGLRIDSVEAVSPQLNFQARGDWTHDATGSRSDFDIVITAESMGSLVKMMNVSSVLEGGQTLLRFDAWWPGPPAAFALARLNGELNISVVDGKILNADAGAGRIVGLLSIAALPRRLALDFRDVFGSGFSFDTAAGSLTLENGTAYTEDLVLESTAATMAISGSSDLVEQQFDYIMTVRPGVSQTLPALGAVIGGPGGAAAGLALQGLLRKSLGDATEARYTIRGPWSSPMVEPVRSATKAPATGPTQAISGTGNE